MVDMDDSIASSSQSFRPSKPSTLIPSSGLLPPINTSLQHSLSFASASSSSTSSFVPSSTRTAFSRSDPPSHSSSTPSFSPRRPVTMSNASYPPNQVVSASSSRSRPYTFFSDHSSTSAPVASSSSSYTRSFDTSGPEYAHSPSPVPSGSVERVTTPNGLLRISSPRSGKRKARDFGDRFIPTRDGSDLHSTYHLLADDSGGTPPCRTQRRSNGGDGTDAQKDEANETFSYLLKSELFSGSTGIPRSSPSSFHPSVSPGSFLTSSASFSNPHVPDSPSRSHSHSHRPSPSNSPSGSILPVPSTPTRKRLFTYSSPASSSRLAAITSSSYNGGAHPPIASDLNDPTHEAYSLSPVTTTSQRVLLSPRKPSRLVSKGPFKVLDAPYLADDYYLNLVDWSGTNVLGVGLASCVYLWSANTSKVTKLCDLATAAQVEDGRVLGGGGPLQPEKVTSLNWTAKGNTVAIGTSKGEVQIWDAEKCKKIRTMTGHTARVGCLAWNESVLSSGSRDRHIYHRDVRAPEHHFRQLVSHRQEVCGLRWNVADNQLASGGNDNKLYVWQGTDSVDPIWKFGDHKAAVKAIAWSPHQRGVLATGGGTADRRIRFWNTITGSLLSSTDTGSQVCNLMWSKTSNEIVSTHGYSSGPVQNQVCIWKVPSMSQVAGLTGHTFRVLYLAMSPDGQTICTGAGDETLRFWNAFQKTKDRKKTDGSALDPFFAKIR